MFQRLTLMLLLAGMACTTFAAPYPRIINGSDASNGEFPFMAALVQSTKVSPFYANDYEAQFCGGTVIAPRWILTAAHCVEGFLIDEFEIITGVTTLPDAAPFSTRTAIAGVIPHPLYDEDKISNDIALIYLATPVSTTAGFSLDNGTRVAALTEGTDLTTIGWGISNQGVIGTGADDITPAILQKTTVDYIPLSRCGDIFGGLHTSALCATFLSGPPRGSCFGDSGGPLMFPLGGGSWQQVGVVSYGRSICAYEGQATVYVNVGQYNSFITGAQNAPDLRVSFGTVGGSESGIRTRSFVRVHNYSPAVAAAGTNLTITLTGEINITNLASLSSCTNSSVGSGPATVTTLICTLGTIAPETSTPIEMALELYGDGPFAATATATSTSGDFFPANNTAQRAYQLNLTPPNVPVTQAGTTPWLMLFALLLLVLRHAPHHSLRLRQFLRLR